MNREKKLVPKLRFPGFEGEWVEKRLGEVIEISSASRVHKHEWTESGVPFFRSSDVVANYKGTENTKAFISMDLFKKLSEKSGRVSKDDILPVLFIKTKLIPSDPLKIEDTGKS
jgi:type I restriction enzyme S subunit